jgi:8-oxo-dGTP diphosphatase
MTHTVLKTLATPEWLPPVCELSIVAYTDKIITSLVTSVHCFCFHKSKVLFVHSRQRGWDLPGGHINKGESVTDALAREVSEEANVQIDGIRNVAAFMVKNNGPAPANKKYPFPISFLTFHTAKIARIDPFCPNLETDGRELFDLDSAASLEWVIKYRYLFDMAVDVNENPTSN